MHFTYHVNLKSIHKLTIHTLFNFILLNMYYVVCKAFLVAPLSWQHVRHFRPQRKHTSYILASTRSLIHIRRNVTL